jgi:hypothetical protein
MMSWIASEYFQRSPLLVFPLIALVLFMLVFVAAIARAALTSRERLDQLARLPLEGEGEVNRG